MRLNLLIKIETNINFIIDKVISCFEYRLKEKPNIVFTVNKSLSDKECMIHTVDYKLQKVLMNLTGNAFKYTEFGKIEMGYKLSTENLLEFYVKDSGIGIEKKYNKEIFNRFRLIEEANHPSMRGTGLGLSISKAYVELLGGTIWFDSEIGKGTSFYFTIPFKT